MLDEVSARVGDLVFTGANRVKVSLSSFRVFQGIGRALRRLPPGLCEPRTESVPVILPTVFVSCSIIGDDGCLLHVVPWRLSLDVLLDGQLFAGRIFFSGRHRRDSLGQTG